MLRLVTEKRLVHVKRDNAGQSGKLVLVKLVVCGNRGSLTEFCARSLKFNDMPVGDSVSLLLPPTPCGESLNKFSSSQLTYGYTS